jgi:hypothetical protein
MANEKKTASLAGLTFEQIKDLAAAGIPLAQAKELGEAGFTFEQISELADALPRTGGGLSKDDLQDLMKAAGGNRTVQYPQNPDPPQVSAFSHPEGERAKPKAKLLKTVYFCGARQDPDQLTPREIDLFNQFDRSYTARGGSWRADLSVDNKSLLITVPARALDDLIGLPAMELICLELLKGVAAVDPLSLAQRIADLEKKLADAAA